MDAVWTFVSGCLDVGDLLCSGGGFKVQVRGCPKTGAPQSSCTNGINHAVSLAYTDQRGSTGVKHGLQVTGSNQVFIPCQTNPSHRPNRFNQGFPTNCISKFLSKLARHTPNIGPIWLQTQALQLHLLVRKESLQPRKCRSVRVERIPRCMRYTCHLPN